MKSLCTRGEKKERKESLVLFVEQWHQRLFVPEGNQYLEPCVFRHVNSSSQPETLLGVVLWGQLHGSSCSEAYIGILGGMTCHIHPYNTSTHHYSYRGSLHATGSDVILQLPGFRICPLIWRGVIPPGSTRILALAKTFTLHSQNNLYKSYQRDA